MYNRSMKKTNCRFLTALIAARASMVALKLLKRNGTHYPGYLALKFCPDFLSHLNPPKQVIAITGTNGKTTTSNLILDVLKQTPLKIAHNSLGSNIQEGIITTLLRSTQFLGKKSKVDLLILEVDERVSPKIYPYIQPDWLVITNLFRDSYRRNAHAEFISDILEASIPKKTKLIVNADDVISSFLCPHNDRFSFGIARLEGEDEVRDSLIKDVVYCPNCDQKLTYAFNRYHHMGHVYCSNCGFTNHETDVNVIKVDEHVHIHYGERVYLFPKIGENITDWYNTVAAIALCVDFGLSMETIQTYFKSIELVRSRFDVTSYKDKRVIVMMAKDQNPIAVSRVFDYIRRQNNRKTAVIFINENSEHHTGSENNAWYYDTDFEYLNQKHITQIIPGGHRSLDFKVRCLLADIPESKVYTSSNEVRTSELVQWNQVEDVYICYGTKTEAEALTIKARLLDRIEREVRV